MIKHGTIGRNDKHSILLVAIIGNILTTFPQCYETPYQDVRLLASN